MHSHINLVQEDNFVHVGLLISMPIVRGIYVLQLLSKIILKMVTKIGQ